MRQCSGGKNYLFQKLVLGKLDVCIEKKNLYPPKDIYKNKFKRAADSNYERLTFRRKTENIFMTVAQAKKFLTRHARHLSILRKFDKLDHKIKNCVSKNTITGVKTTAHGVRKDICDTDIQPKTLKHVVLRKTQTI